MQQLAGGNSLLHLFWPTIIAYLRIATHPSIFEQPLDPQLARQNVAALVGRPNVRSPGEQPAFWDVLDRTLSEDVLRGDLVSDAHLVALMRQHHIGTIWTSGRDFRRFDRIRVRDPNEYSA